MRWFRKRQPIVIQVTTPIQVDGHTLAETITRYQLQGARSTGNLLRNEVQADRGLPLIADDDDGDARGCPCKP